MRKVFSVVGLLVFLLSFGGCYESDASKTVKEAEVEVAKELAKSISSTEPIIEFKTFEKRTIKNLLNFDKSYFEENEVIVEFVDYDSDCYFRIYEYTNSFHQREKLYVKSINLSDFVLDWDTPKTKITMHNSRKPWNAKIIVKPRSLSNVEDSLSDNYFKVTDEVKSLISNLKEGDDYYSSNGGSQRVFGLNANGTNISKLLSLSYINYRLPNLVSGKDYFLIKNNQTSDEECVDFVKALTNNYTLASNWTKGKKVIGNDIPIGTVIATYNNGVKKYTDNDKRECHAAIYMGQKDGYIVVLDQNWFVDPDDYSICYGASYHRITSGGENQFNSANYYTVTIE